jgi:hypothetical protein
MKDINVYKTNLESRFNFRISFWSSIVAFFTHSSPYDEAIKKIQEMDLKDAFQSDAKQLHRDFQNACKNNI